MTNNREVRCLGASIGRPPIVRLALIQIAILVLLSSSLMMFGAVTSYSFLLGGLVAVVAQLYFAARLFRLPGSRASGDIASSGYAGIAGKFALSAAGFAAIFALVRPIDGALVLLGFIGTLIVQYTLLWTHLKSAAREKKELIDGS